MGGRDILDFGGAAEFRRVVQPKSGKTTRFPFAALRVCGADECVRPYMNLNRERSGSLEMTTG
jgi:hypothetical protein